MSAPADEISDSSPYRAPVDRGSLSPATRQLLDDGYTVLRAALSPVEVAELRADVARVFGQGPSEVDLMNGHPEYWRFLMFERSALAQRTLAHRAVLDVIEPLLGRDCHVIANTAWMTPRGYDGGGWHTDAGPHVPRPEGVPWDDRIPYPVFIIACMMYLTDVPLAAGPTAVVPGSHRSARPAPERDPAYEGRGPLALEVCAGDIALLSSDLWHRGMPNTGGEPRMVFQVHYGRRDMAQRFAPALNHRIPDAVVDRATSRGRLLLGLHPPSFYG